MNKVLQSPFPFFLNDERKNMLFITGASVYVVLFMTFFHTNFNHVHQLTFGEKAIFGLVTFITLFVSIIVLPRLFPQALDPVQWNVGKYIVHMLCNLVVMGFVNAIVDFLYITPERSLLENLLHAYRQVAIISIIPVTLTSLILRNNMLLQNLLSALEGNNDIQKLRALERDAPPNRPAAATLLTLHTETSETLTLPLEDLLFVQADDNYSTVFWKTADCISKKLLRANLKYIEAQINSNLVLRCHRSYLVHISAISNISGNANGYKLQVLNSEHSIPVSRAKGKEIIETIRQQRNMMEISA